MSREVCRCRWPMMLVWRGLKTARIYYCSNCRDVRIVGGGDGYEFGFKDDITPLVPKPLRKRLDWLRRHSSP